MKKADAIAYFGSVDRTAKALGVSRIAIYSWKDTVHLPIAFALQEFTKGKLKVNLRDYREANAEEIALRLARMKMPPAKKAYSPRKAVAQETA
jgi:hypothetical protein